MFIGRDYNPAPNLDWPARTQVDYTRQYQDKYYELTRESLGYHLLGVGASAALLAITATATAVIASVGLSLAATAGKMAVILVVSLSLGALGATAAVLMGIWIAGKGNRAYQDRLNLSDNLGRIYGMSISS
jgi:hypothetical protein